MASAARLGNKVDASLLAGCVVLSLVALVLRNDDKEPIASALRRTVVAPLVSLQRGAERWRTAWVSSEQRQLVVDSLALRAVKVQALQAENDQLRKIVGLGTRLESGFIPAEALHSTAQSEEIVTSLTLTAGSTAGVQKYSPVVAPEGLVGTIQTADPTMSTAILYTNPDFRASAMAPDGVTFGIVYPHSTTSTGGDAYMLEMRGVPTRSLLKPGTTIFTSGLGGTFPRGITIGTIVQEIKTSQVWTKTYLVRPAVSPSRLTSVLILVPQRVTQGIGNVWGAAVNLDSAAKRIAMAGDSIQKQAALLEAKARQATLDSVKRVAIDSLKRALGVPTTAADSAAAIARAQAAGAQPGGAAIPRAANPTQAAPVVRDTTRARPAGAAPRRDTTRRDTVRTDTTGPRRPPPDSMNWTGAVRTILVCVILIVLHYTLRPLLAWRASVDFLVVALLLGSVRLRPGAAAVYGFILGLIADSLAVSGFGAAALAMSIVGFAASWLKAVFFADNLALNGFFLFLAKWAFDLIFLLVGHRTRGTELVMQIFVWSPLSAAVTAVAGVIALSLLKPLMEARTA